MISGRVVGRLLCKWCVNKNNSIGINQQLWYVFRLNRLLSLEFFNNIYLQYSLLMIKI